MSNEQEFTRLVAVCLSRLTSASPDLSQISADLYKAETSLRQLKIEATYLPKYQQQEALSRCVKYLSDINNVKKQLRDREQERLFGDRIEQKVKSSTGLLERQGGTLELGKKLSLESEAIAVSTMENLRNQRGQLERSTAGSKEISENLSKSNRIITSMQRRTLTNKIIMICVIFLLITAIILVGFNKLTD